MKRNHLYRADIQEANLQGANLQGAYLEGFDLSNASLKEAKNLIINQFYNVKTLYKTELDESLCSLFIEKYSTLFDEP